MKDLQQLGLTRGRGALPRRLLQACHGGRLVGGLSISLRATPDEVVGALTHAMGGEAVRLKVLDVRYGAEPVWRMPDQPGPERSEGLGQGAATRKTGAPMLMEIGYGESKEKWELEDVPALVHNLNDLFHASAGVKLLVVLGEWEDMLQLWALERGVLEKLLAGRRLDDAWNAAALRRLLEPPREE